MSNNQELENKILNWLSKEGYPLEFKVANIFKKYKFHTHQGDYVNDYKTKTPRELDVVAKFNSNTPNSFLRIEYIVECKWTGDKPWIIFTDENSQISSSACVAQAITANIANSILWLLAKDKEIQSLSIFKTPQRPGFNGRQAFGSQNDIVYSTLQSVVSASYSEKKFYESYIEKPEDLLSSGILIIPIIVIDGKLYESFYNKEKENIEIEEQKQIRLHWRGAEAWNLHSTIDIVTIDALSDYVENLEKESIILMKKMISTNALINKCLENKTIEPIEHLISSSRGVLGLPSILDEIINKNSTNKGTRCTTQ